MRITMFSVVGTALFSCCQTSIAYSAEQTTCSYLFADNQHVASESNIKRSLQQPTKLPKPVITSQGDWDSCPYLFGTVIFDHQEQIYKAWYMSYNYGQPLAVRTPFLYATSSNGRDWTYPTLGLFEHNGSKQNNIILQNAGHHDSYSPSVIKDRNERNPSRRYKMIFWDFSAEGSYKGNDGMMIAFSPDGIHWKRWQQQPVLASAEVEQSISDVMDLLIDPLRNRYVAYTKGWADPFPHHRQIVRTESTDFINWSSPEVVLRHANTVADPESYGMPVFIHEGMYFGLLRLYHSRTDHTIDIQLTSSHDGKSWNRVANQATFLPNGNDNAWDRGMLFSTAPVIRNDVMEFFYGAWDGSHNSTSRSSAIGLATLPLNRFTAIEAIDDVGTLQTKPLVLTHPFLSLNASVRKGRIRVALTDAAGSPLPGFSLEDCDRINGNSLRHQLTWRGQGDVAVLKQKQISLLFEISGDSQLFAFRNHEYPEHR